MIQKKYTEAKFNFEEAVKVIRELLMRRLREIGKVFESTEVTVKTLVEPSVFDNDEIKNLKALLWDMYEKSQEVEQIAQDERKLEEMKKEEGEQVKVDPNFGKAQANAE
jgi:endonuclease III-like uncharacterized protein